MAYGVSFPPSILLFSVTISLVMFAAFCDYISSTPFTPQWQLKAAKLRADSFWGGLVCPDVVLFLKPFASGARIS
ncbi:hypothetical protein PM082_021992 [Marasmius tenuissimus]|nr:hypothetical protein PM082_021992 [Marasmius tenuissimus]